MFLWRCYNNIDKKQTKAFYNKRLLKGIIISIIFLAISVICFWYRNELKNNKIIDLEIQQIEEKVFSKEYYKITNELNTAKATATWMLVIGIISGGMSSLTLIARILNWKAAHKLIDSSTSNISINQIDKQIKNKMEQNSKEIGKMTAFVDKYKYAEIAKTIKNEIDNDNDNKQ